MGSTPYWGPNESARQIFLERAYLAAKFLNGVGYGMQFALYISCASYLWNTRKLRGKQSTYLLAYITLLFCVETILVTVHVRVMQVMYVDNRNYPGGPWQYYLDTQYLIIKMYTTSLLVLTFLSDLLVLWRCWIIWGGSETSVSYAVVAFPLLMVLASLVMGILWARLFSQPGAWLHNALHRAFGVSYFGISLSLNIVLTILITIRLLVYRRRAMGIFHPGHASQYFSLAAIFVESAALYSIIALAFIVSYAMTNPISQIFMSITSSAQQISGYLIIYRLAAGRAWNRETSANTEGKLPTLHFLQTTSGGTATTGSTDLGTSINGTPFILPSSRQDPLTHITADEKKDREEVSIYSA